ncbi:MAG: hypothetical protein ABIM89_13935 [Mycobacteriales bacterium]
MLCGVGFRALIRAAVLLGGVLVSVAAALIRVDDGAVVPTPVEILVPVVLAACGLVLHFVGRRVPSGCLVAGSVAWSVLGLAGRLPIGWEESVLRLSLLPLALVLVSLLTLPTGDLRRPSTKVATSGVLLVAALAGAGVPLPVLALLGLPLAVAALVPGRLTPASLAKGAAALTLIALEYAVKSERVPTRVAADAVGILMIAGALVVVLLLDGRMDMWSPVRRFDTAEEFGRRIGAALGTGAVRVAFPVLDGSVVDLDGRPQRMPSSSTVVEGASGDSVAWIAPLTRIEPSLFPALLGLLTQTGALARMRRDDREQLERLAASRRRLVTAADEDLGRIRILLHRSVLSRLEAMDGKLEGIEASERILERLASARRELEHLGAGLDPTAGRDLADALRALTERDPTRVTVSTSLATTPPALVARTAWFVASEVVSNVLKHAAGAAVRVEVRSGPDLLELLAVDNGPGGVPSSGLTSVRDRVRSAGGTLAVDSDATGTRIQVLLPYEGGGVDTGPPVSTSGAELNPPVPNGLLGLGL